MLERVYDTLQGILYYELPKDYDGNVVIYDRKVHNWFLGDREVRPSNLSIILSGSSSPLKDIALGLQEFTHKISITVEAGGDNANIAERLVQEGSRLVLQSLRKHRRIWVVEYCPICTKFTLSPEHFLLDHEAILEPYKVIVETEFETLWQETHPDSIPPPTLPNSGLSNESFLRMYEAVRAGDVVANLPTAAKKNILRMQSDFVDPIRMLYDVNANDTTPSDDGLGKQLTKVGTITLLAKELIRQTDYGPDNVPTSAISKHKQSQ
jgi:hypothetical protein